MARISSLQLSSELCLVLLLMFFCSGGMVKLVNCQTWCIAKPSSSDEALQKNINFACSLTDCAIIQNGGPCFFPDSAMSHASVAMNLYYQSRGRNNWNCDFSGSGLVVITDPSYDNCKYA
ncbi:major pollen allergen Ole e 10-like [Typha latifolia]|uniref:major pollen allergen Ole e 10-like n=1 Tax=Typha latifolia TaxID=4733 RepID=UPI003C2FC976